jgi:hypothetical protein
MSKLKAKNKRERLKPLSLYPLTVERALSDFLKVDPKRVKAAERKRKK